MTRKNIKKSIRARLNDDFGAKKCYDKNCREPAWQYLKSALTSHFTVNKQNKCFLDIK